MGCRLSKSYLTIIESPSATGMDKQSTIELIKDAHELIHFLREDSDFKCIFIFGGYGSNKGEFLFDLLNHDQRLEGETKSSCQYVYLDVEELIIKNIRNRVKQLTGSSEEEEGDKESNQETLLSLSNSPSDVGDEPKVEGSELPTSESTVKLIDSQPIINSQRTEETETELNLSNKEVDGGTAAGKHGDGEPSRWEDTSYLKKYFSGLTNVITNNWIRSLIEREIVSRSEVNPGTKFIINLVPNRINLFRDCLYLKQGPNFSSFEPSHVAVNLIRADQTRKDLDLVSDFHSYEDISDYFVDYFRIINKLIEVKIETKKMEPQLKLTRSSEAIKVLNCAQLEELLKEHKPPNGETIEIDVSQFTDTWDRKGSLVFLIDNQIDTGSELIAIDSSETDVKSIRNFVHFYCQIKESLHRTG